MKKVLFSLSIFSLTVLESAGQRTPKPLTTSYANFLVEDGEIIWQLVYERPGMDVDLLKESIYGAVISDNTLRIIEENEDELIVEMRDKIFEKNGDLFSGRLIIGVREGRYRVTLSGVRRFFGVKTKNLAFFVGVANQIDSKNVGMRLEDAYLNKAGGFIKNISSIEIYNALFEKEFNLKVVSPKKDDW
jgi:hypothetical protein